MPKDPRMENTNKKMGAIAAQGTIEIELSTRPALRLWQGREKTEKRHGIIGVPGFSKIMKGIEASIRADDPYADYHYQVIEQAIEDLKEHLEMEDRDITMFLSENVPAAMRLPEVGSESPTVVPVRFVSKLGFQLTYQVLKVDQIVLKVLSANHIGLLSNSVKFETLARLEKKVRSVMHLIFAYHNVGVTRDDMAANNKKAQIAIDRMGQLEKSYLEGSIRSESAPALPMNRLKTLGSSFDPAKKESPVESKKTPDKSKKSDLEKTLDAILN
mgnify:CR=1 FL=1